MKLTIPTPAPESSAAAPAPALRFDRTDLILLVTMLLWGANYSVVKAALELFSGPMFNALRFGAGVLALGIGLRALGYKLSLPRREMLPLLGVAFISYWVYQWFFTTGLHLTSVAHNVLIITLAPIGVVIWNIFRGKDRFNGRIGTGIALAAAGVVVVIASRYAGRFEGASLLGDALSLGAAVFWVWSTLALHPLVTRNSAPAVTFWLTLCGALMNAATAAPQVAAFDWSLVTPVVLLGLAYSGIFSIGVGGVLWGIAIRTAGTSKPALYANLQPITAAVVAIIALGEPLTVWLVVGTAVTLVGMALVRRN